MKKLFLTAALTALWAAAANSQVTVTSTPESGQTVGCLKSVNITFDGQAGVRADNGWPTVDVLNAKGEKVAVATSTRGSDNKTVKFTVLPNIYDAGTYSLTIPAYSFYTYDWDENWEETNTNYYEDDVCLTYTVDGTETAPVLDATLVADPAAGTVGYLTKVTISSVDYQVVVAESTDAVPYVVDADGQKLFDCSVSRQTNWSSYCYAVINLPSLLADPGTYELVIPAESMRLYPDYDTYDADFNTHVAGVLCAETRFSFDVTGDGLDRATSVPEDGSTVSELTTITLTFDDATKLELKSRFAPFANLYNSAGKRVSQFAGYDGSCYSIEDNVLTLKTDNATDNDTYQLVIPATTMKITAADGTTHENTELKFSYTVDATTGLQTIVSSGDTERVCDLQGRLLKTQKAAGLYIKNGVKVIVK